MKCEPVELTKSIAKSGTIYLGELWGIALTLEFVNDIIHTPERLDIFVDCTSVIASCTVVRPHVSHQSLIQSIQNTSNQLSNRNCSITYHKVAAHVNIEPNERADNVQKRLPNQLPTYQLQKQSHGKIADSRSKVLSLRSGKGNGIVWVNKGYYTDVTQLSSTVD